MAGQFLSGFAWFLAPSARGHLDCLRGFLKDAMEKQDKKEFCEDIVPRIRPLLQNIMLLFSGSTPRVSPDVFWDPFGHKHTFQRDAQPFREINQKDNDTKQHPIWPVASQALRETSVFGHLAVCDCVFKDPKSPEQGMKLTAAALNALFFLFHDPKGLQSEGLKAFPSAGPHSLYNILNSCVETDPKWPLALALNKIVSLLCTAQTKGLFFNEIKTQMIYCKDFKAEPNHPMTCAGQHIVHATTEDLAKKDTDRRYCFKAETWMRKDLVLHPNRWMATGLGNHHVEWGKATR